MKYVNWSKASWTVALIVCSAGFGGVARAQEAVSDQVWLGSMLFTNDDLENLHDAVTLTSEQREASLELMRGAMSRARTMTLKTMRGMQDMSDEMMDEEDQEKQTKHWGERQKKSRDEVLAVEKEVMNDVKSLLEGKQVDEGWPKFERSRRRILMRAMGENNMYGGGYMHGGGEDDEGEPSFVQESPLADMIAIVRASKLSPAERELVAPALATYESGTDALIQEWRPLGRKFERENSYFSYDPTEQAQPSKEERAGMRSAKNKMLKLQIRTARAIDDAVSGPAEDRFLRERLRTESNYRWQSLRRTPQVAGVLKLRSISPQQKKEILALVDKAEEQMIAFAIADRKKLDDRVLQEKKLTQEEQMAQWTSKEAKTKAKEMLKTTKKLTSEMLAVLTPEQRNAYESGFENQDDLNNLFQKRRASNPWEMDQDINPWQNMDDTEVEQR